MTTLVQAVTRSREDGQFVADGPVRVEQLQAQFPHAVRASMRDLIAAMRARAAVARPFAVIFCRFKGDDPHPDEAKWEKFYREAFMPGTGGFVDFWRDASLGKIDVSGTQFFGWIEVDIARADAGYVDKPPPGVQQVTRTVLTNAAIRAVQDSGADPITGFFNQISLYMFGQTQDGLPIDGSADADGRITPDCGHCLRRHEQMAGANPEMCPDAGQAQSSSASRRSVRRFGFASQATNRFSLLHASIG